MASVTRSAPHLTVTAHRGDCKTLLGFNLAQPSDFERLAGFTIRCRPHGRDAYFLWNTLRFKDPAAHAQVAGEPPQSTVNAPIHKFRWLHVPGSTHQGLDPFFGPYTYTVTPRYFDANGSMLAFDESLGVSVEVEVGPFRKEGLALGFTRGYTQSQAFAHHFGRDALIRPNDDDLLFDTAQVSGHSPAGRAYTYAQEYAWLGMNARRTIFAFVQEVLDHPDQYLDVFAYDLNEPDFCRMLLKLAGEGRVRVILDNAALHHSPGEPRPEDRFEAEFRRVAKAPADIRRGHFQRYAHDKVLVSFTHQKALKVLTGSTNFSVTGLYVNSNHVLVFDDSDVAATYGRLFETVWGADVKRAGYLKSPFAALEYDAPAADVPPTRITFAPHDEAFVARELGGIVDRVNQEAGQPRASVLFAVMDLGSQSPVCEALARLHSSTDLFSYGISDSAAGVSLYAPGQREGVLVTGKPGPSMLPPPFDQVRVLGGVGHQVHHKFVVCGFGRADATVYCGSSNLAVGGEQENGDNLLAIRDRDVATAFAVEAVGLVDHFLFLDRMPAKPKDHRDVKAPAAKDQAAAAAGWFLSTNDAWTRSYLDPADLHCAERLLFA